MAELDAAAAFDRISSVYDATRSPIDPETMDAIARHFTGRGISKILEVGVGTGRIALPLLERRFSVVGVDASAGMLARARAKGVPALVRGTAYRLPFRDGAVDATLFVHVLHVLDEPEAALREACRVGRSGATALVRPPLESGTDRVERNDFAPDRLVAEILAREGHPLPRRRGGPRVREGRLLRSLPPDELEIVSDRTVTEPLAERLAFIGARASRHFLDVPPELLARAVAEARERIGERTVTYRHVEALATWNRPPATRASTAEPLGPTSAGGPGG